MSHTILSLNHVSFDTRTTFGGCLININGETYDCEILKDSENFTSPTYTVIDADTKKELCTFRPYHVEGGPLFFQIEGVSNCGGDATLVVPEHGMLSYLSDDDEPIDDYDEFGL